MWTDVSPNTDEEVKLSKPIINLYVFFFFCKAAATFIGRLSFLNMQIEGWMKDAWGGFSPFLSPLAAAGRCSDTSSCVIFTVIKNKGRGMSEWQSGAEHLQSSLQSLLYFNVRKLNPKRLEKFGEKGVTVMNDVSRGINKCIKAQWVKLQLMSF